MNLKDRMDEEIISQYTCGMDEGQKFKFLIEYNGNKKNRHINLGLIFAAGWLGLHKFYLGDRTMGFVYLGISIWLIIDYFIMMLYMALTLSSSMWMMGLSVGSGRMADLDFANFGGAMIGLIVFGLLLLIPALVLLIFIIIDICTFRASVKRYNSMLAEQIVNELK